VPSAITRPQDPSNKILHGPRQGAPERSWTSNTAANVLEALRTIPNLSIHYGHFLSHPTEMPLAGPPGTPSVRVRVIKTEEKGSDVNLATHLIHDGHQDDFDVAVVISNDSNLLEPISRRELEKPVGVISPHKSPSVVLRKEASFVKTIRKGVLAGSQFPHTLTDADSRFRQWHPRVERDGDVDPLCFIQSLQLCTVPSVRLFPAFAAPFLILWLGSSALTGIGTIHTHHAAFKDVCRDVFLAPPSPQQTVEHGNDDA